MIKLDTTLRNAILDLIESTISTAPLLQIFTGAAPANCAAADTGTKLAELELPADWMNAAAGGSKTLAGTWSVAAIDTGAAGHFRIKATAGTTCYLQGTITATGGGGDMTLNSTAITTGQTVQITTFTLTAPNA